MNDVDVFILAAGFGKRLGVFTEQIPKPLVPVHGKPLINYHLDRLLDVGIQRVIINTHYLAEKLEQHVTANYGSQLEIIFAREERLLDSGGGIKNIEKFLKHELLLTINADSLFGIEFNLARFLQSSRSNPENPLATLLLLAHPEAQHFGEFGVDFKGRITSYLGRELGLEVSRRGLLYTGVQTISRELIALMPEAGSIFSITKETYPRAFEAKLPLWSEEYLGYWNDVGTPERLAEAERVSSDALSAK